MEVGHSMQDSSRHGGHVRVSLLEEFKLNRVHTQAITFFKVPREDNLSELDPLRMDERGLRAALQRQSTPSAK